VVVWPIVGFIVAVIVSFEPRGPATSIVTWPRTTVQVLPFRLPPLEPVMLQPLGIAIVIVPLKLWPGIVNVRCDVGVGDGEGARLLEEVPLCVVGAGAALDDRAARMICAVERDALGVGLAEDDGCAEDDDRAELDDPPARDEAAVDLAA
jgi:hypothetical protein